MYTYIYTYSILKIANGSFENVAQFKCLGTTLKGGNEEETEFR
jgi:hypothetical protein